MAGKKIYVPMSSAKSHTFADGGSILKLGFKVEDLIAFAQQHANARGWLNLIVSARRQVGERGDTHSIALDTYQPKAKSDATGHVDESEIPF